MKKSAIALAVVTAMGASAASAATFDLTSLVTKSNSGTAVLALSGNTLFTTGAGNSLVSNGSFSGAAFVGLTPLFTWTFGAGTTFSNTVSGGFDCYEGVFGGFVGASICGNYNFGANYTNESTINTDGSNRVIGGDDVALGPAQSISMFGNLIHKSWISEDIDGGGIYGIHALHPNGDRTVFCFATADPDLPGEICDINAVPVPAAAYLFGSALGLLGWARRKSA